MRPEIARGEAQASPSPSLSPSSITDTPVATFTYDGDGRRISGTAAGVTTHYPFPHYEVEGTTVRKYYFLGAQRIAVRNGGALSYLLTDHLNSASVSTDASGVKTSSSGFLPFGGQRYSTGVIPSPYRFTGEHFEAATGLMWIGSRWYDPLTGRWSQPDTLIPEPGDPQALNRYSWVLNQPLRYTDPTGHCPMCIGAAVGALVGMGLVAIPQMIRNAQSGQPLTANIDPGAVIYAGVSGALLGAGMVALAPVAVALAGDALMGAGLLAGGEIGTGLFSAGLGVSGVAGGMAAAVYGVPKVAADGAVSGSPKGEVYTLRDAQGNAQRSGRTKDLARREVEHRTAHPDLNFEVEFRSDSYQVQRGAEQILHNKYNPPLNKIQPISPRNPRRNIYLNAARKAGMK